MRRKRGDALKFGLGHCRLLELPKGVAELVVESCRVGKIAKPCFYDPKTTRIILFFQEGSLNEKVEFLVLWRECSRSLKRFESLFGLIVAFVSLRKQVFDACACRAPFT